MTQNTSIAPSFCFLSFSILMVWVLVKKDINAKQSKLPDSSSSSIAFIVNLYHLYNEIGISLVSGNRYDVEENVAYCSDHAMPHLGHQVLRGLTKLCFFVLFTFQDHRYLTPYTPICIAKAVKNVAEAEGMRKAHVSDLPSFLKQQPSVQKAEIMRYYGKNCFHYNWLLKHIWWFQILLHF